MSVLVGSYSRDVSSDSADSSTEKLPSMSLVDGDMSKSVALYDDGTTTICCNMRVESSLATGSKASPGGDQDTGGRTEM